MVVKVIFIFAFLVIFLVAFLLLKPFRMNMKRPYSTMTLKLTYLVYLVFALFFTYMFMFYNGERVLYLEDVEDPRATIHFILMLTTLFVPNAAVFVRRRFRRRTVYNTFFSFVNVLCTGYYTFLIYKIQIF